MVRDHYERLGFSVSERRADGGNVALLDLDVFEPPETFIHVSEGS